MSLKEVISSLTKRGLIKKERIGFDQIQNLLSRAQKDVKSAKANLSIDEEVTF